MLSRQLRSTSLSRLPSRYIGLSRRFNRFISRNRFSRSINPSNPSLFSQFINPSPFNRYISLSPFSLLRMRK
jgi:hypothetical protein